MLLLSQERDDRAKTKIWEKPVTVPIAIGTERLVIGIPLTRFSTEKELMDFGEVGRYINQLSIRKEYRESSRCLWIEVGIRKSCGKP